MWKKFLLDIKDYGSLIGSCITIILFICGFIINKQIEKHKEKKRLLEIEKYFKTLVKLLEKPLLLQRDSLVKLSNILKDKKDLRLNIDEVTNFHVEEMKKIDEKDLFSIFIKNKKESLLKKTELFGKLKSSIDYISRTKQFIIIDFKDFGMRFEKHQAEFKESFLIIEDLFRSLFLQNESSLNRDFFFAMNEIRADWTNPKVIEDNSYKHTDRHNTMKRYIEPLKTLCERHISEKIPNEIFKYVMLCIYAYDNLQEVKHVYRQTFLTQAKGLQKNLLQLEETIKKFESISKK
jgi:hypothetical protein